MTKDRRSVRMRLCSTTVLIVFAAVMLAASIAPAYAATGAGNALDFDGTDDYVDCGDINAIDGISQLTIEAWVNWRTLDRLSTIASKRVNHYDKVQFGLGEYSNTDDVRIQIGADSLGYGYTTGDIISTGTWYHVAMVFDGSNTDDANRLKFYLNGVQQPLTYSGTLPSTTCDNSAVVTIGAETYTAGVTNVDGQIDEVRIWHTARTEAEIRENMNNKIDHSESGLISYYRFDQSSGMLLPDLTSGNDGTLQNMDDSDWVTSTADIRDLITIHSVVLNTTEVYPGGAIFVTVDATSDAGVTSVTADGVTLLPVDGTYEGTITAVSTPGTYTVTVVATDASGNGDTDNSTTYTVLDATPPTINSVALNLTEVAPNGSISVTVNVTDASGIASVTADNVSLTDVGNDIWEGTITAANASGTYNVTVVAIDNSTNSNSVTDDSATYTVKEDPGDLIPPVIHSVLLDPTVVEPNDPITVTVNVTDNSSIASVTANDVSLAEDAENGTWIGTITAANASGTYNVTVVAIDNSTNSNNVTDDSATYTVKEDPGDLIPPVIHSVLLDPTVVEPNDPITVTVNVTDNSSIASVTANDVSLAEDAENGTWIGTITAANASGTYNVTVVAIDNSTNSNNVTDDSATYTVKEDPGDLIPPVIHSVLLDPTVVEPNDPITVTVNVTDNSSIASVTANDVSLAEDAENGTWIGTITAANASGTYNVTVVAIDNSTNSNNVTDDSVKYTVHDPPVPPATRLHIGNVAVRRGESETVPITVFNVTDMGGCEITFTYDPKVVYVTDVARGDLNYSFEYNINNGSGWMRANALDVVGQSGDVIFAYVTLTAVGNKSDTSEMEFEDSRLVDASFGEIAHVRDNGLFTIPANALPEVTNVSATPATILYDNGRPRTPGTNLTSLSAYMTDADGNITTVTIDLSSIGGLPDEPMEYVSGDLWTVTTNATEVAINVPDFDHQLTITATDDDGGINDSASIELIVLKRGDVNGDGLVDKVDADYISRYLAGLEPEVLTLVGDVVGEAGDPVGNGVVDLMDALYIAKYTSGAVGEP